MSKKSAPEKAKKELCPDCDGEGCESCNYTGEDQSDLDIEGIDPVDFGDDDGEEEF